MNTREIIQSIDVEIQRLEEVKALLTGAAVKRKRGRTAKTTSSGKPAKRRVISAEGRARMAAAQKLRWAKSKGGVK